MSIPILTVRSLSLKLTLSFLIALSLPGAVAFAQGDLLLSPIRIVFEGSKKSQEINLANVGKDTATYVISVVDYRMRDDGGFDKIDTPDAGQNFAGPFLRFFPRRVTLAPNEAQVVKLQLIKTNELLPGEYRSHLYFRAVPDETPIGDTLKRKKDTSGISIQLVPVFGITIPVIIRVGENTSEASLSNLIFFSQDKPTIHFVINRSGNMSVYGDIKVEHINTSGKATEVKVAKGIGIYTPNATRNINLELDGDKGVNYHTGKIRVTYTLSTSDKSVKTIVAETDLK